MAGISYNMAQGGMQPGVPFGMYGQGMMGPMGGGNPMIQNLMKMRQDKMSTLNDKANTEAHTQATDEYAAGMELYGQQVAQNEALMDAYNNQLNTYQRVTMPAFEDDVAQYEYDLNRYNTMLLPSYNTAVYNSNYVNDGDWYGAWENEGGISTGYTSTNWKNFKWPSYQDKYRNPTAPTLPTSPTAPTAPLAPVLQEAVAPSFNYEAPDPYAQGISKADRVINSGLFQPFGLGQGLGMYGSAMIPR